MELLNWARGPGLGIALAILVVGVLVRLFGIFALGMPRDLARPRASGVGAGWRTVWSRSFPRRDLFRRATLVFVAGYLFHIGFLVALLLFGPHILLVRELTGVGWPALATPVIDFFTIVAIAALFALLVHRLLDPVRRFLSGPQDYLVWVLTTAPLVTGYLALHTDLASYETLLAWHVISAELLLAAIPFTKLMHMLTFATSRWYNGYMAGRKGVQA